MQHIQASLATCVSLFLAMCLPAQASGTFVVNAAGGPGVNYTDITTAVASVPNRSTLIVRAGTYAPVVIDAKTVVILCDANVFAGSSPSAPFLNIAHLAIGQSAVVRGLRQGPSSGGLVVHDCDGVVVIDGLGATIGPPLGIGWPIANRIDNVASAYIRGYSFTGINGTTDSQVVFESCSWIAQAFPGSGGPGLQAINSDVQSVRSSFRGANGWPTSKASVAGGPGIQMMNSTLRCMGQATDSIVAGLGSPSFPTPPIAGSGTARIEPGIQLIGTAPLGSGITLSQPIMPSLSATSAAPGGSLNVARYGANGVAFAIAASLPGPASSWPSLTDRVWLDGATVNVEGFAMTYGSSTYQLQMQVPTNPALRGASLCWQSIEFDAGGGITVSNPSFSLVW